jgi:uncharacterized repeat protein (TIGR01451 family)
LFRIDVDDFQDHSIALLSCPGMHFSGSDTMIYLLGWGTEVGCASMAKVRRFAAATLTVVAMAAALGSPVASADVIRPFTQSYQGEVFGDFLEIGNGSMRCPDEGDPVDPAGVSPTSCVAAQAREGAGAAAVNDSYYMRFADVDEDASTFNSSRSMLTVPPGARVAFAQLNWAGDTGRIKLADGTISDVPGCNTRQFGAGAAVLPPNTPGSTPVRLTVADRTTTVRPATFTVDPDATFPANDPQYYSASAEVTAAFTGVATGAPVPVTVADIWSPQGFGCFAGWSLVVVFSLDAPDPVFAPARRAVVVYDGHVRQAPTDEPTVTSVRGFRAVAADVRIGATGYEGDHAITGDQLTVNGTALPEPSTGDVGNFFVSDATGASDPAVPSNLSVDAKQQTTDLVPAGSTTADLAFVTDGDSYLATGLAFSAPVPALSIVTRTVGGPFPPGAPVQFTITVTGLGGTAATDVAVAVPAYPACDRTVGELAAGESSTYSCTGPAPEQDTVSVAVVTGTDSFGAALTAADHVLVDVADAPAIDLELTVGNDAPLPAFAPGAEVPFTLTTTNTGDTPLTSITVTDPTVPSCSSSTPTLAPGESVQHSCSAIAPIPGGSNTATATGTDPGTGVTVTDTATVAAPTPGAIGGRVYADRDGDGTFTPSNGETGIGGVTVTLTGESAAGPTSARTTTAPDGTYRFEDLLPGIYRVEETQPPEFADGPESPGTSATVAGTDVLTVVLPSAGDSTDNDFTEIGTSGLSGAVFGDLDGDGVRGPGELPITGVTVTLRGTDTAGNPIEVGTTTGQDGGYAFPRLPPGTYALHAAQPAGFFDGADTPGTAGGVVHPPDGIDDITLPAGTNATGYHFGELLPSGLSGLVGDERGTGVPGASVTISGTDDAGSPVIRTVTTGPDGSWSAPHLPAGTYSVTVPQPAGYGDGPDIPGTAGGTPRPPNTIAGVVLVPGQQATGYTFTQTLSSIAGSVAVDVDGNGVHDADEPGIAGVEVGLTGTDAGGTAVTRSAVTDGQGTFLLDGLRGGRYALTETQPAGFDDGPDAPGTAGGTASAPDTITGIILPGGVGATGYHFFEQGGALLSGTVVDDAGNGIPGVPVALTGTDGVGTPVERAVTSGPDGSWSVPNLPGGTYSLSTPQPVGYGDGPDIPGSAGGTPVPPSTISGIGLEPGEQASGYTFTKTLASLAGAVYVDLDGDGVRAAGEPGIPGVTVTLTGTDVTGAAVRRDATTAPEGGYLVDGLLAGTYEITETQPVDYGDGADSPGDHGGAPTPPDTIADITLPAGVDAVGYGFGERGAELSGTVADDTGVGLAGVPVTVSGTAGSGAAVDRSTATGPDGSWSVPGLPAGTYDVSSPQPAGYGTGPDAPGTAGGAPVPPNTISGIDLGPGEAASGYVLTSTLGSISGVVWADSDGDGVRGPADPGIGGVVVTVSGTEVTAAVVHRSVVTDADGAYRVHRLLAGTYAVQQTQPAGYDDGPDTAGSAGGTVSGQDVIFAIPLGAGVHATGYDFDERIPGMAPPAPPGPVGPAPGDDPLPAPGEVPPAPGGEVPPGVSGTVFVDRDGGGVRDAGEPGVPGVRVTVQPVSGGASVAAVTGPDGTYALPGLPAGEYLVTQVQQPGYGSSSPNRVAVTVPADGGAVADFADTLGLISGEIYTDTDGDGTRSAGEAGTPGVRVLLSPATGAGGAAAEPIASVSSGPDGEYRFDDVPVGSYLVAVRPPDGWLPSPPGGPGAGDPGAAVSAPVTIAVSGDDITRATVAPTGLRPPPAEPSGPPDAPAPPTRPG